MLHAILIKMDKKIPRVDHSQLSDRGVLAFHARASFFYRD